MSDSHSTPTPPPEGPSTELSRLAVERVLARAAELHTAESHHVAELGDPTDAISEARLLEIAREVGLSTTSVRQALAEERTRVGADLNDDNGWLTRLVGPGIVSATRSVRGKPADVIATLDSWMQREECLRMQRRFPDRIIWHAKSDWFNTVRRNLRIGGRAYLLCRARFVGATVIPIDDERVLVRLDADITPRRAVRVRLGAVAGVGGVALSGSLLTLGAVVEATAIPVILAAIVPLGLGGIAGYAVARQHQQLTERVALALEQALDRLEFADPRKPSLRDVVAAIKPLMR